MIVGASPEARPIRLKAPALLGVSLCLIFLSACTTRSIEPTLGAAIQTGRLENPDIREASGLALSRRQDGRLWTMNDGGSAPVLYALSSDGTEHGTVHLTNTRNVDWEDMASFELGGTPWLLVADVGDNLTKRQQVTLYIVAEPDLSTQVAVSSRQIRFRYPDGPLDVEAVAVDANEQRVYLLSKRTVPARLYSVPLATSGSTSNEIITATYLGTVASIPQPTQDDQDRALAEQNWHWQPTAMDFSADGKMAVILTYPAAYLYDRQNGESWLDALQRPPVTLALGSIKEAEAIVLGPESILVTVEARHAPIYRIQYRK